jgi:ribosomal protein S6
LKTYEAVFILDDRKVEDGGDKFIAGVEQFIQQLNGTVSQKNSMGRRQFARRIGKRNSGIYWDLVIDLTPASVAQFQERYRLDTTVLRLVVFNYEEPPPAPVRDFDD